MNKRTDDGRTKFNTDVGQFPETGQKPSAGQDVPLNDDSIRQPQAGLQQDRAEQDIFQHGQQRGQQDNYEDQLPQGASITGRGTHGKSEFGGSEINAPKRPPKSGTERKGGVSPGSDKS